MDVRNLHSLVVKRSAPEIAGRYADQGRFVVTDAGRYSFPSPAEVPAEIVKDWRAELLALTPAILAFSERRRRRLRDRSRRGDNLRRVFEQTLGGELAGEDVSVAF